MYTYNNIIILCYVERKRKSSWFINVCVTSFGIGYRIGCYNIIILLLPSLYIVYGHSPGLVKVDAAPLIRRVVLLLHHNKLDAFSRKHFSFTISPAVVKNFWARHPLPRHRKHTVYVYIYALSHRTPTFLTLYTHPVYRQKWSELPPRPLRCGRYRDTI